MNPPARRAAAKTKAESQAENENPETETQETEDTSPKLSRDNRKSNTDIAQEVLNGAWGNHEERQQRLEDAGYEYDAIQRLVNKRIGAGAPAAYRSTLTEIAKQVIAGHYGDDEAECRRMLEGAGWNFAAVKAEVERLSD